jgi:hypothetical protein
MLNRVPIRTTDVIPAPRDTDVHVIEGAYDDFDITWTAVVTAIDNETAETADALPVALALAASGQLLTALLAVRAEVPLPAHLREMVNAAIEAALDVP